MRGAGDACRAWASWQLVAARRRRLLLVPANIEPVVAGFPGWPPSAVIVALAHRART
jgi:hypothetical protein